MSTVWDKYFNRPPSIVARAWHPVGGWRGPLGAPIVARMIPDAPKVDQGTVLSLLIKYSEAI